MIFQIYFQENKKFNGTEYRVASMLIGHCYSHSDFLSFSIPLVSVVCGVLVQKKNGEGGKIIFRDYERGGKTVCEDEGRDILSNSTTIFLFNS